MSIGASHRPFLVIVVWTSLFLSPVSFAQNVQPTKSEARPKNNVCSTYEGYFQIDSSPDCSYNPDVDAEFDEIVANHGYPYEKYEITTEDGYILDLFRLPRPDSKKIVLLQPPAIASGSCFVIFGNQSLGFILYDAGYDVWVGNFRGSFYARKHVTLNPNKNVYWNFSYHEIGIYDHPAQVDFIRSRTNYKSKIGFLGHSMGGTSLLIYASLLPDHARENVNLFIAISPGAILKRVRSDIVRFGAPLLTSDLLELANQINFLELLPKYGVLHSVRKILCKLGGFFHLLCSFMETIASGHTFGETAPQFEPIVHSQGWNGLSLKCIVHYCQSIVRGGDFIMYDYGREKNIRLYGRPYPPKYPMEKVSVPVFLIYGDEDLVEAPEDQEELFDSLSDVGRSYGKYKVVGLGHVDTMYSKNVKDKVNLPVLRVFDSAPWG